MATGPTVRKNGRGETSSTRYLNLIIISCAALVESELVYTLTMLYLTTSLIVVLVESELVYTLTTLTLSTSLTVTLVESELVYTLTMLTLTGLCAKYWHSEKIGVLKRSFALYIRSLNVYIKHSLLNYTLLLDVL